MAIYKRDDSPFWQYDFTVKGRRFRGSTETDRRQDAEIVEAKLKHDAIMGVVTGQKARFTLNQAFGWYYQQHGAHLPGKDTIYRTGQKLLQVIGKDFPLHQLSNSVVARYIAKRRGEPARGSYATSEPGVRARRLISNSSVNRELQLLRAVVYRAKIHLEAEIGIVNWKELRLREPDHRTRYLSNDEAERLLEASSTHLRPIIEFALLTGARAANILGLDWSQVDLPNRRITFKIKSKKQGGKNHVLPVTDDLARLLGTLGPKEKGPVFTYDGAPVRSVKTAFTAACRRAEIKDFRFHDLRHTAGSWMVQSGIPLEIVKEVLGHEVIQTTMRYAHHDTEAKDRALATLASRMRHAGQDSKGKILIRKVK